MRRAASLLSLLTSVLLISVQEDLAALLKNAQGFPAALTGLNHWSGP